MSDYYCIGIDPGVNGAIGCIKPDGTYAAVDTPTIKVATASKTRQGKARVKQQYNENLMVWYLENMLSEAEANKWPVRAIVEDVHSMPRDGSIAAFTFGESKGIWRGMLAALRIPYDMVSPAKWKPQIVGKGADKDASRVKAQRMFPKLDMSKKKDHNRAEALLLAEYLKRQLSGAITDEISEEELAAINETRVKPKRGKKKPETDASQVASMFRQFGIGDG